MTKKPTKQKKPRPKKKKQKQDPTPISPRSQLTNEAALWTVEKIHEEKRLLNDQAKTYELLVVKGAFAINGAAALAMLAFLGNFSEDTDVFREAFRTSIAAFGDFILGVAFAVGAGLSAFLRSVIHSSLIDDPVDLALWTSGKSENLRPFRIGDRQGILAWIKDRTLEFGYLLIVVVFVLLIGFSVFKFATAATNAMFAIQTMVPTAVSKKTDKDNVTRLGKSDPEIEDSANGDP